MKKILLLAFISLSFQSFAQQGLYIRPTIGAGIGNIAFNGLSPANEYVHDVATYSMGAGIGYKLNHIRFETGLTYLNTGVKNDYGYTPGDWVEVIGDVASAQTYSKITERYTAITLPAKVGYEFALNSKLSIVPMVGAEVAFWIAGKYSGERYRTDFIGQDEKMGPISGKMSNGQPMVMGNLGLQVEYHLNRNWTITAGPTARYILANGVEGRPHIMTLEAGILRRFAFKLL